MRQKVHPDVLVARIAGRPHGVISTAKPLGQIADQGAAVAASVLRELAP